jgi:hypothetical protein
MPDQPESINKVLRRSGISDFRAELERQARLLRTVRRCLPGDLPERCRHCAVEEDRLLIYTDAPAFAYQLRFYGPQLLEKVAEATGEVFKEVQVRNLMLVGAVQSFEKPRVFTPPGLSVAQHIRETAENSPHEEIREALLRLSRTMEAANKNKELADLGLPPSPLPEEPKPYKP